jgi:hypothetical protein
MIVRELDDERTLLIRQEDHADLSGLFAAHWGNDQFSRLDPYESMVCASTFHDSHFRDVEAVLPIDMSEGRPYSHRTTPFWQRHFDSLQENIAWLDQRDRYAALLVSMHHSGLPQNRYGVINSWQSGGVASARKREPRPGVAAMVQKMEAEQQTWIRDLEERDPLAAKKVWFNFRLLEVFDLLSLYFCCDGFTENGFRGTQLGPVPTGFGTERDVTMRLVPVDKSRLRLDPYPFDCSPFEISVVGRIVRKRPGATEAEIRDEYWRSPRQSLSWIVTD